VEKEAQSSRIYQRLAETATLFQEGKAGLWRDPDLQLALEWREQYKPNVQWARRYHPNFGLAEKFLEESRQAREAELREKELQQARELQLVRDSLKRVSDINRLAGVIARVSAMGNRETHSLVVESTLEALGCDAVTLYAYDQSTNQLIPSPQTAGLLYPEQTKLLPIGSIVYQMLQRDTPYIVSNTDRDQQFKNRRFTAEEQVKSLVAVPLIAAGRRTGVIFFNYRREHYFTDDELQNIEMFAHLAAVAIYNAQLFEEKTAKLNEQNSLARLSQELLKASSLEETLQAAVEVARSVLKTEFSSIVLEQDGDLLTCAVAGWEKELVGVHRPSSGQSSHTGYTIISRSPVSVTDYAEEKRFAVPDISITPGIKSGLSAPMTEDNGITGAILVQTIARREFSHEEATLLSLIANQASIALQRAQQSENPKIIERLMKPPESFSTPINRGKQGSKKRISRPKKRKNRNKKRK
jgi:GAF domain-containing protein